MSKKWVSLKELVEWQKLTNASDLQLIREFLIENDLEEESAQMITDLLKSRIEKIKNKHRMCEEWASYLPSEYLYENYDLETASFLHHLELNFLSFGGELNSQALNTAKERVPKIKRPKVYFNPLVEWLEKQGVEFIKEE